MIFLKGFCLATTQMGRVHQFSQNLDLFYSCFETISLLLRFYRRLFISQTFARHEIQGSEMP